MYNCCRAVTVVVLEVISYHCSEKGPNTCFEIILFLKRYLDPLQLHCYAMEIGLSIMELPWPEFLLILIPPFYNVTFVQ